MTEFFAIAELATNMEEIEFEHIDTPDVVNIRKANLNAAGYADFADWAANPDHVYIGRNMCMYVPGTAKSKWANPFAVKKYGLDECLRLYEQHVRDSPELMSQLLELRGKTLGCWCCPNKCHGDVLAALVSDAMFNPLKNNS